MQRKPSHRAGCKGRKPSHFARYEASLPSFVSRYSAGIAPSLSRRIDLSARYQLLSPWPDKAIAFTTAVERVARLICRARSGMAFNFQLTVAGWRLLRLVAQSGSRATLTCLARRLRVTRPSARATASRLRDGGYLSFGRVPGDRRFRRLEVTDAGLECLSEMDAAIDVLLLEMTNDIPAASLQDASRILDRMTKRLRACETLFRRPPRRPAAE